VSITFHLVKCLFKPSGEGVQPMSYQQIAFNIPKVFLLLSNTKYNMASDKV